MLFVDDHEVHQVVENIKSRGEPNYMEEIVRGPNDGGADAIPGLETSNDDADPLYDEAVKIVYRGLVKHQYRIFKGD